MAALTMSAMPTLAARSTVSVQARKTFAGAKVAQKKAAVKAVVKTQAVCKSDNKERLVSAATVAAVVAASAVAPPEAMAEVTPSLKNLLGSVVAGGVVLGGIAVAVVGVSSFDKVNRS